jgi:catechol 2,3-dioxygenase-like lactoylglutathione lyase family enzyme
MEAQGSAQRSRTLRGLDFHSGWKESTSDGSRENVAPPRNATNITEAGMSNVEEVQSAAGAPAVRAGELRLEVVVLPVADIDRAKEFYEGIGWRLDANVTTDNGFRLVQLTPPGSGCSIQFGTNITPATPGSAQSLYLIVSDINAARDGLIACGVEVSDVFHEGTLGDRFRDAGRVAGPSPDRSTYGSFAAFSDPDGNGWLLQEITSRLPGR